MKQTVKSEIFWIWNFVAAFLKFKIPLRLVQVYLPMQQNLKHFTFVILPLLLLFLIFFIFSIHSSLLCKKNVMYVCMYACTTARFVQSARSFFCKQVIAWHFKWFMSCLGSIHSLYIEILCCCVFFFVYISKCVTFCVFVCLFLTKSYTFFLLSEIFIFGRERDFAGDNIFYCVWLIKLSYLLFFCSKP